MLIPAYVHSLDLYRSSRTIMRLIRQENRAGRTFEREAIRSCETDLLLIRADLRLSPICKDEGARRAEIQRVKAAYILLC
jgi:hypothetical protein